MKTFIGYRYNVRKHLKTKTINVGNCENLLDAENMMIAHYNDNSKRGNVYYSIMQEQMNDYDGVVMCSHSFTIGTGIGDYYKRYTISEIKTMSDKNYGGQNDG